MKDRKPSIKSATLRAIVKNYIEEYRPNAQCEIEQFKHHASLHKAIEEAAFARDDRGKRFSHQRRLTKHSLEKAFCAISEKRRSLKNARTFEDLLHLLHSILDPIEGIGELYIYDTALRIGASRNQFPKKVYLHCGTREGAKVLGFSGALAAIEVSQLPKELRVLKPYEIEDVLCLFRESFEKPSTAFIAMNGCKPHAGGCVTRKRKKTGC